jgi:predicted DNA-binding protein YlxM (UPF0122 family)
MENINFEELNIKILSNIEKIEVKPHKLSKKNIINTINRINKILTKYDNNLNFNKADRINSINHFKEQLELYTQKLKEYDEK